MFSAENGPWRAAARSTLGVENPLYRRLTDPVRSDFIHALPWDQIQVALDIGSDLGTVACDLALYAKRVVAVTRDKAQADFVRRRASEDNLSLTTVLANAAALPFAAASFDLITVQHDRWWGSARSEGEWLRKLSGLLREGGYLCILGSRARGLGNLLSLGLALVFGPFNLTLRRPRELLSKAGFSEIHVFGVAPSIDQQRLVYDPEDFPVRQYVHARFNPPVSNLGRIRRAFTDNRALYKLCEKRLVIFARRDKRHRSDLLWEPVTGRGRSVVQLNTSSKVMAITFLQGKPSGVLESQKAGLGAQRDGVKRAFRIVQRLQYVHRENVGRWPMRWPLPLGAKLLRGREVYAYEFAAGREIAQLLLPVNFDSDVVMPLVSRAMRDYLSLSRQIGRGIQEVRESGWAFWHDQLVRSEIDAQVRVAAIGALARAKELGCPLGAVHGDLSATNLVLSPSGTLILLDWEHFNAAFMPAIDLIRFAFDALSDVALLPRAKRAALVRHVRAELSSLLNGLGITSREDMESMRWLYVAHQLIAGAALDDPGRVLARYTAGGDTCPFQ